MAQRQASPPEESAPGQGTLSSDPIEFFKRFLGSCKGPDAERLVRRVDEGQLEHFLEEILRVRDPRARTPIHAACDVGHICALRLVVATVDRDVWEGLLEGRAIYSLTPLHMACMSGQTGVLELIHRNTPSEIWQRLYERKDQQDRTPLCLACRHGQTKVVRIICEHFDEQLEVLATRLKDKAKCSLTALHFACTYGHGEVVKQIYDFAHEHPSVIGWEELTLIKDLYGKTALHFACIYGHATVVDIFAQCNYILWEQLSKVEDKEGYTAFHRASSRGQTQTMEKYMKHCKPDLLKQLTTDKLYEDTIKEEYFHTLAALLSARDIFKPALSKLPSTILPSAFQHGSERPLLQILQSLSRIDLGLNPTYDLLTAKLKEGKSILQIACSRGYRRLVREILFRVDNLEHETRAKRDILSHQESMGVTALHECCQHGHSKSLLMILQAYKKYKCSLSVKDSAGKTPFWYAFELGDIDIVQPLLETAEKQQYVSDVLFTTNGKGQTIIHRACMDGYSSTTCLQAVIRLAERSKIDDLHIILLQKRDMYGNTFISYACETNGNIIALLSEILINHDRSRLARNEIEVGHSLCESFLTFPNNEKKTAIDCCMSTHPFVLTSFLTPFYNDMYPKTGNPGNHVLPHERPPVTRDTTARTYVASSQSLRRIRDISENESQDEQFNENITITNAHQPVSTSGGETADNRLSSEFHLLHFENPLSYYRPDCRRLLRVIGDTGCLELIKHEYTQTYMQLCWKEFVRTLYSFYIVLHACVLTTLTTFVMCQTNNASYSVSNASSESRCHSVGTGVVLFLLVCLMLAFEILQMIAKNRQYWKTIDNWAAFGVCIGCLVISIASFIPMQYDLIIHQIGIATMLLVWVNGAWLMTKISFVNFEDYSLKFIMLFKVIRRVFSFLPVIIFFVLTVAVVYVPLLQKEISFSHLGFSIVRSLVMTVGELEYTDLFFSEESETPPFYVLTFLVFVIFIVIMNISMINLLVGVAVGDISELKSKSDVISFRYRADLIMESMCINNLLKKIKNKLCDDNHVATQNS